MEPPAERNRQTRGSEGPPSSFRPDWIFQPCSSLEERHVMRKEALSVLLPLVAALIWWAAVPGRCGAG